MKRNDPTLWGPAQTVTELIPGIWHVTTASHGGIKVSDQWLLKMPLYMRRTPYSRDGWFEEDIDWCLPFIVFENELRCATDDHTVKLIDNGEHILAFQYPYHRERREAWEAEKASVLH